MTVLQARAQAAIDQHKGLAKAARALRINRSVLCLLATGKRTSASPRTLRALGLKSRRRLEVFDAQMDDGRGRGG